MWIKRVSHPRSHPESPQHPNVPAAQAQAQRSIPRMYKRAKLVSTFFNQLSMFIQLFPQPPDSPRSPHRTRMQDKPPSLCSDGFPPIRICGTIHHSATQKLQSRRTGLGNNNITNTLHKNVSESLTKVRSSAGLSFPRVILFSRTPNRHWSGTRTVTQKPLILRR
jgi:hypothetical protein